MTKTALRKKTNSLITEAAKRCREKIEKVIKSGCVDVESYEDNYMLPKLLAVAILKDAADQYRPPYPNRKTNREIKNVYLHI